jgi:hypothetical protein
MSWLSVRAAAWAFLLCNFGLVSSAMAARLPTSALIVHVLSVDQESFNRSPAMLKDGKPFGDQWYETTGFIAKAQIQNVIRTDHGLTPGQTITIRYKIRIGTPQPIPLKNRSLKAGEDTTVELMGRGTEYELRP